MQKRKQSIRGLVSHKAVSLFLFCPQIHGGAHRAASSRPGHRAACSGRARAGLGSPCPVSLVPSTWDLVRGRKAAAAQAGRAGTGEAPRAEQQVTS